MESSRCYTSCDDTVVVGVGDERSCGMHLKSQGDSAFMIRDPPEVHGKAWPSMCTFWFHTPIMWNVLWKNICKTKHRIKDLWDPSCSLSTPDYLHQ